MHRCRPHFGWVTFLINALTSRAAATLCCGHGGARRDYAGIEN
jgi:hypothetical protein